VLAVDLLISRMWTHLHGLLMNQLPDILSLLYRNQIDALSVDLKDACKMQYFVMYIIFNDGRKFVVSNIYHMLFSYYAEALYKEDYHCADGLMLPGNYYICDEVNCSSQRFKETLESRFGVYRTYYIERVCGECKFVFGAVTDVKPNDPLLHYRDSIKPFEHFAYQFVLGMKKLIVRHNPQYSSAMVFNDDQYLQSVIYNKPLSAREKECLYWAARGKSVEETSLILNISIETVKSHRKNTIKKLHVTNVTQAVFQAAKRGLFLNVSDSQPFSMADHVETVRNNIELINQSH